jgi:peptidyl-tRNA hydrolase
MIDKAAHDEVGQQGAARHHLGQRQIDSGRLADLFAGPAHQSWPHVTDDPEARRDIVEDLSDSLVDLY